MTLFTEATVRAEIARLEHAQQDVADTFLTAHGWKISPGFDMFSSSYTHPQVIGTYVHWQGAIKGHFERVAGRPKP